MYVLNNDVISVQFFFMKADDAVGRRKKTDEPQPDDDVVDAPTADEDESDKPTVS